MLDFSDVNHRSKIQNILFGKSGSYFFNIAHRNDDRPVEPNRIRKSLGKLAKRRSGCWASQFQILMIKKPILEKFVNTVSFLYHSNFQML